MRSFSSANYALRAGGGHPALGSAVVKKKRIGAWFPLASGDAPELGDHQAVQTGCSAELTEISLSGADYTSVGFD